ncbi:MAG TPA: hypothetical protein DCG08_03995 [Dialister sp.]|nr:hypothetical protein [Dialister sp.]
MQKRDIREYRIPPYRHFERKREIFFVRGQAKDARKRITGNAVLHMNWNYGVSDRQINTGKKPVAEKDPSAPLGMTIRENGLSHISLHTAAEPTSAPSGHLLPRKGGRIHTIPRTKSLPRVGKVASVASRIGF